jgi:flavodoxin
MRSLVIYDPRHGDTERLAHAIAEGLNERGEVRVVEVGHLVAGELEAAQLVVLGAPARIRGLPRSMRRADWFARAVAIFDAQAHGRPKGTGSAAAKLEALLRDAGAMIVVPTESFFVAGANGSLAEGEVARARVWGRHLHLGDRVTLDGE